MKPFETVDMHGHTYLHFDNWARWKHETLSAHPGEGKWRFDLDLRHPRQTLEEVPVLNSQVHSYAGFSPHTCFYECGDWSTIYDFYECDHEPMFRMIVESQNPEPIWGERIILLSTSTYFKPEPWGRNTPNQFAFFRGMYWQVNHLELLCDEWPSGVGYPLRDGGRFRGARRGHTAPRILDAGYIYAPYVPVYRTPVVVDPETFRNTRDIITRYGRRLLEEGRRLYGTLTIGELNKLRNDNFKVDWTKEGF